MRAMIADDELIVRRGIKSGIDWKAYGIDEVLEAENGQVCLEKMARQDVDLLIADIRMPKLDGVQLGRAVSERYARCKIIFISAYTDKEYLKSAISLNVVAYVEKPIPLAELRGAIEKAAARIRDRERQDGEAEMQRLLRALLTRRALPDSAGALLKLCACKVFCCAQIHFRSEDELELYVETDAIGASFAKRGAGVWVFGDLVRHNYVAVCAMPAGSDVVNVCREGLEAYGQTSAAGRMFASVGSAAEARDLPLSFEQAGAGMQALFFRGYGCVTVNAGKNAPRREYRLGPEQIDLIRSAVHNRVGEDFESVLRGARDELLLGEYTSESVKSAAIQVLGLLSAYGGAESTALSRIEKAARCETLDELEALIRRESAEVFRFGALTDKTVRGALNLIAREYGNINLSIGYICRDLDVSKSKLCGQFRQATGKSINEYINDYRMMVACEFIRAGEMPLKDVARQTGFNDLNYFSKTFKKIVGVLPSAYKDADA